MSAIIRVDRSHETFNWYRAERTAVGRASQLGLDGDAVKAMVRRAFNRYRAKAAK